jgi:hypothetical protein
MIQLYIQILHTELIENDTIVYSDFTHWINWKWFSINSECVKSGYTIVSVSINSECVKSGYTIVSVSINSECIKKSNRGP